MHSLNLTAIALGLVFLTSCGGKPPAASAPAGGTRTNEQVFLVKGVVKKLGDRNQSVTIQHEEIPNFMPAMTMPFSVKDTNELRAARPGDNVSFRLHVTQDE